MDEILTQAYSEHGKKIVANYYERANLLNKMNKNITAGKIEVELCLKHNPDYTEEYGILRFFKYHLWTHDPRKNILDLYGMQQPKLPFLLYDFQKEAVKEIVESILSGNDILIEKSRDMGVSWLVISISLWFWLKHEAGNDILIGSRKFDYVDKKGSLDTLIEKFRYNLYQLHPAFMPDNFDANRNDNVGSILNPHTGSFLRGEANNPNFATSGRYLFILADEFSKWEETDEQAWTSMGDSSPSRIALSTPWGMGRKFAKLRFGGAIKVLTFHWTLHPIKGSGKWFDESQKKWRSPWYDTECSRRSGNERADIGQELDIDYLSTGFPYFDNDKVQNEYEKLEKNPPKVKRYEFILHADDDSEYLELFETENGRIWIKDEPVKGWEYRYAISADIAEGLEHGDNSVAYVYDRITGFDVAGFTGKIDTRTFAYLLAHLGNMYNEAYIAPENNSHGAAVLQKLKEIYNNIYHEEKFDMMVNIDTVRMGWNTNKKTRAIMCSALRESIDDGCHGIVEKEVFSECITFVNINGKPQADAGNWDDRIMAQAIKWMIHDWLPAPKKPEFIEEKYKGIKQFGGGKVKKKTKDKRRIW